MTWILGKIVELLESGETNWLIRGSDIKSLVFHLEDRDQFYQLYRENVKPRFIPKQQRLWKYQEFLRKEMSVVQKPWIRSYYVDLLEKSEKNNGNWEPDERLKQVRQYAKCFRRDCIDSRLLSEYVYQRRIAAVFCR